MCFISRIRWGQFIVCLHYAMPEASDRLHWLSVPWSPGAEILDTSRGTHVVILLTDSFSATAGHQHRINSRVGSETSYLENV